MTIIPASAARIRRVPALLSASGPGLLVAATVAVAAQFLSEHYGAPAMLMALLLGIALHFLAEEGRCVAGIDMAAITVLRIGVALLGIRISADLLVDLGLQAVLLLAGAIAATILLGLAGSRLLGRGRRFGLLTAGAVAICGASAAMAIAAVLPRDGSSERNLIFTVLSVTILSTLAMIFYPMLAHLFALDDRMTGFFLGATIHDVAQVVGAGFSVSPQAGETATLVKLIRVAMLAPVVLVISLALRRKSPESGSRPALLPGFVIAFLLLAAVNSTGFVPAVFSEASNVVSRWALLMGIAAVGMKTSLQRLLEVGGQAVTLIVAETLFLAGLVLAAIHWLPM